MLGHFVLVLATFVAAAAVALGFPPSTATEDCATGPASPGSAQTRGAAYQRGTTAIAWRSC
jgi:hypothetical protein